MHALNTWKQFNKGLIASRDETRVIGTFHVAADHPEKDYIRAIVLRAEALETALRRLHGSPTESDKREAGELLAEIDAVRHPHKTQE